MEIIIALVIAAGLVYWFFFRTKDEVVKIVSPIPVGIEAVVATTVAEEAKPTVEYVEATVELAPVAVATSVTVEAAPAKKPRKPRAPKAEATPVKPAAKKAAPTKKAAAKKTVSKKA
jgi:hypothetical protein